MNIHTYVHKYMIINYKYILIDTLIHILLNMSKKGPKMHYITL